MGFSKIREILSSKTKNIGIKIFESEEINRNINYALDVSKRWHQRNCPLNAPFMMRFVFSLMLFRNLSIANVLKMFIGLFRSDSSALSLKAVTPEAVCHAKERLGVEPIRIFFEEQAKRIQSFELFKGMSVWSVDGSSFNLPDTPSNELCFGRPKSSAYPQMEVVSLVETTTRQVGAIVFMPCDSSERAGVMQLLDRLGSDSLLLMDRGISSGLMFWECQKRGISFLGRLASVWKPSLIRKFGTGDSLVRVKINTKRSIEDCSDTPEFLELRLIEYKIGKSDKIRLLTDLTDPEKYPALELAKMYHSRWECELAFDELKNRISQRASGIQDLLFRSKTSDGVLQEAYALAALYNIVRGLMVEAGKLHNISPLNISFVDTLQVIKNTIPLLQSEKTDENRKKLIRRMQKDIAGCENRRPRRERQYSRVVKKRVTSKFKAKTSSNFQKLTNFEQKIELVS